VSAPDAAEVDAAKAVARAALAGEIPECVYALFEHQAARIGRLEVIVDALPPSVKQQMQREADAVMRPYVERLSGAVPEGTLPGDTSPAERHAGALGRASKNEGYRG
jgi:hypothetical protein